MAGAENASSRPKFRWASRLVLAGVAAGFGYLYVTSLEHPEGSTADTFLDALNKLSPIPINVLPATASSGEKKSSEQASEQSVATEVAASTQVPAAPVQSQPAPQPRPAPVMAPVPQRQAMATSVPQPQAAPAPLAAPAPYAASQQSSVGTPAPAAESSGQSVPAAAMAPPRPEAAQDTGNWAEYAEQRRAQMQARYEAMRQQADEQMRRYWDQVRASAPAAAPNQAPYSYPGYPAYAPPAYLPPGYAPGAYAPR